MLVSMSHGRTLARQAVWEGGGNGISYSMSQHLFFAPTLSLTNRTKLAQGLTRKVHFGN